VSRALRAAAIALAVAGATVFAWVTVTLVRGDPVTARSEARAQATLRRDLAREEARPVPTRRVAAAPGVRARAVVAAPSIRVGAAAFAAGLRGGDPVGRIVVPRLGLRAVVVEGTGAADLARGPGHYRQTPLPGRGGTVAIAGHRTTYGAPFRHADELRRGDEIVLELPYGTFRYRVYRRSVVAADDWSIVRRRPFEQLVLSTCHPLYSATHRLVVFARLAGQA
jgi:sortase A